VDDQEALAVALAARRDREDARLAAWQRGHARSRRTMAAAALALAAVFCEVVLGGFSWLSTATAGLECLLGCGNVVYLLLLRRRYSRPEPLPRALTAR
jgi:hypothetical protein